ncbi:hypothetical protein ANCDUO_12445, partial [Ancylostoma duodenale]
MRKCVMGEKYDENFDICELMREAGYPGTFRLPKSVLAVRKQANPMSHISQHTAASRSTSSHHVGPVTEVALNMFTPPNQQTWSEPGAPTPMNSGYVGVAGFNAPVGYNNVAGTVPAPVPCGVPQMMNPEVQIIESRPVNQGDMQNAEIGDVNEFFVTNVFQEREPSNNMPPQVGSPPMTPFKPENVDYGYETGQMYTPVITQPVYPPQHEPPVVRTAAGGESDRIIKFEEPSDYEQPFPPSNPDEFANFEVMSGMPMTQPVHAMGPVENVYATTNNSAEAQEGGNAANTPQEIDKYIKEIKFESSDDEVSEKVEDHGGGTEESVESAKQKSKKCKEPSSEPHDEEMDTSDVDQKRLKADQGDYLAASGSKEQKERKRSKAELDDEDDNHEAKEVKKDRSGSVDEKSERKKSDDRRERKEERFDKHGYEERREKPRVDDRRDDRSDRYRNDDRREKSDDYRRKNYDSSVPY